MDKLFYSIPVSDVPALVRLGDGNAALLYLHLLGEGTIESAPEALCLDERRVADAQMKLLLAGLSPTGETAERDVDNSRRGGVMQSDDYRRRAVNSALSADASDSVQDRSFYVLVQEVQRMMGRVLSSDDLMRLFGIYDKLKLPADVILQLIRYCMDETRSRNGDERPPSLRYIEKAAYTWEREGIFTLELAEKYLRGRGARRDSIDEVKKLLQIHDRELTPSERKYVESWLSLGFGTEAIAMAYDRTVTNTGHLTWKYMNSIIVSWHGMDLHDAEEIAKQDTRPQRGVTAPRARAAASNGTEESSRTPDRREFERMKEMLSGMEEGKRERGEKE